MYKIKIQIKTKSEFNSERKYVWEKLRSKRSKKLNEHNDKKIM